MGGELRVTLNRDLSNYKALVVYLDSRPFTDFPVRRALDEPRTIIVTLARTADNDAAWRRLLSSEHGSAQVPFAVGLSDLSATSEANRFRLKFQALGTWRLVPSTLLVALAVLALIAVSRGVLTDAGLGTSLSLGRCQMFVWTSLIVFGFLTIWVRTGATDTITSQSLVLLGISAATALGSVVVDSKKNGAALASIAEARAARDANALKSAIDASAFRRRAHDLAIWEDLLKDANGWSLYRLQVVVWTIVFGVLYLYGVIQELAMPQFSDTILALMGVSGGVYVGFKLPEAEKGGGGQKAPEDERTESEKAKSEEAADKG